MFGANVEFRDTADFACHNVVFVCLSKYIQHYM